MRVSLPRAVPAVLAFLLLGAHFFRAGWIPLMVLALGAPLLFVAGRRWALLTARILLALGALEWVRTLAVIAMRRQAAGAPWLRMALILGAVAAFTAAAACLLKARGQGSAPPDPASR